MEAYKELFRHKRNEEKRQEVITCFQQIWTAENVFGRLQGSTIKWNITPHQEFLPKELGAWTIPPIRINRLSPSPDIEAEFTTRPDFANLVDAFVRNVGNTWQPSASNVTESGTQQGDSQTNVTHTTSSLGAVSSQRTQTSLHDTDTDPQMSYWQFNVNSQPPTSKVSAHEHQQSEHQQRDSSPSASTWHDEEVHSPEMDAELRTGSDGVSSDSKPDSYQTPTNTTFFSPHTTLETNQPQQKTFNC
jgi:hypothetical protein